MNYAAKYEVSRASRKYNKSRSYIFFWKSRWNGSVESLATQSRRPHHHPNEHTEAKIKLIRDHRRRCPDLELPELWHRLKKKGYTRCITSLYRVMKKFGMLPSKPEKKKRVVKPYEQMTHLGERVQIDVKVVPRRCIADKEMKIYQYTAIDEYTRLRFLYGYEEQSTYSSADLALRAVKWFKRRGITVECIQTDNGFEFTNRFSRSKKDKKTMFEKTLIRLGIKHKLIRPYTPRHGQRSVLQLLATFKEAYASRKIADALMFHSDQGANSTSKTYRKLLQGLGVSQSFLQAGVPYDNSVMESFFKSMKTEELYRTKYHSESEFRKAIENILHFTIVKDLILFFVIVRLIKLRKNIIKR